MTPAGGGGRRILGNAFGSEPDGSEEDDNNDDGDGDGEAAGDPVRASSPPAALAGPTSRPPPAELLLAPSSSWSLEAAATPSIPEEVPELQRRDDVDDGGGATARTDGSVDDDDDDDDLERHRLDLFWSYLSDSFFVAGGALSAVVSFCDWLQLSKDGGGGGGGPGDNDEDDEDFTEETWYQWSRSVANIVAPSLYLVNSVVDVMWARSSIRRKRMAMRRSEAAAAASASGGDRRRTSRPSCRCGDSCLPPDCEEIIPSSDDANFYRLHVEGDEVRNVAVDEEVARGGKSSWCACLTKHAGHRRALCAAFTFGIAALFAVVAATIEELQEEREVREGPGAAEEEANRAAENPWPLRLMYASIHFYILSAVISVTGKRERPWFCAGQYPQLLYGYHVDLHQPTGRPLSSLRQLLAEPESLEDLGDLFFLVGSFVDGILCDAHIYDDVSVWGLLSDVLWFLDACLYLRSDFIQSDRLDAVERRGERGMRRSAVC